MMRGASNDVVCSCDCATRGHSVVSLHSDVRVSYGNRVVSRGIHVVSHDGDRLAHVVFRSVHVLVSCVHHAVFLARDGNLVCVHDVLHSDVVVAYNVHNDDGLVYALHDAKGNELLMAVAFHIHLGLVLLMQLPTASQKQSVKLRNIKLINTLFPPKRNQHKMQFCNELT